MWSDKTLKRKGWKRKGNFQKSITFRVFHYPYPEELHTNKVTKEQQK